MDSIIQTEKECFFCGKQVGLESHHVFNGNPNRKLSEKYGLKVWLCHEHHNEFPNGVHFNVKRKKTLQDNVQRIAMEHYDWNEEQFRKKFGKSFLLETEKESLFL